jgi:predicted DNA-binding protein with PD1-like motif
VRFALRLEPGEDLRGRLEALTREHGWGAAFVIAGVGSLRVAALRLAEAAEPSVFEAPFELLTLAGSLSPDGAHLHASVADAQGAVSGGHVCAGCIVRTTVELLIERLDRQRFERRADPRTGYSELVVRPRRGTSGPHQ